MDNENQQSIPVKRGRGRPRKYEGIARALPKKSVIALTPLEVVKKSWSWTGDPHLEFCVQEIAQDRAKQLAQIDHILYETSLGRLLCDVLKDAGMPARCTFTRWLAQDENLENQYNIARSIGADQRFDEILGIVEKEYSRNRNGGVDAGEVQARRLHTDVLFKTLAKLFPQKFGERVVVESAGAAAPIALTFADVQKITQQKEE